MQAEGYTATEQDWLEGASVESHGREPADYERELVDADASERLKQIAARVACDHNRYRRMGRPVGLVFSPEGWSPAWTDDLYSHPADRIVTALREQDVTAGEILDELVARDAELAERAEDRWQRAEANRILRETEGPGVTFACYECGSYVRSARARCGNCGSDPTMVVDGYQPHEHPEAGPRVSDRQRRLRRERAAARRRR